MSDDPLLLAERRHLNESLACLEQMREAAERIADYGVDALASESLGRLRADRLRQLSDDGSGPPFFGRTDRDPDSRHPAGEVFHIGRRHIRDSSGDPMVIDWRAPIARPFYRASTADRQGVRLRRRFGFADGRLTSFEDEHLDAGQELGLASHLLRDEIERPRVGPMRDIVATIQPDQDELVRADLDTSLCIQGAPGTGKTAVGLHRAAYLLYSYPERLRRSGVLVVGPNSAFLRYIAQVLPALGENGIQQSTVDQLVSSVPAGGSDPVPVAILKGDARMAEVLRRAVFSHVAKPAEDAVPIVGTRRYRIPVERLRRYVDDARRSMAVGELHWDNARERLRQLLAQDVRRQREDAGGAPSDAETAKVARSPAVREFVDTVWPALDPRAVLVRLYTEPEFARRCAGGRLDAEELALLSWASRSGPAPAPPAVKQPVKASTSSASTSRASTSRASTSRASTSAKHTRFSPADLVLLDELAGLITGTDGFVHVVVDEAQDLSPMQCRAVARRCPLGSLTVLGDQAQTTAPWAAGSWELALAHLGHPAAQIRPLTIGYRVPAEVLQVANRLLPHIAADVPPASSIRTGDQALSFSADLAEALRRCLAAEGSIAVIVPDARVSGVLSELAAAGITAAGLESESDGRVTVVAATAAKGLEFDSVVLLEPAEIVAAEPSRLAGLRRLYVCWTRAVSRLAVVHHQPLPAELAD